MNRQPLVSVYIPTYNRLHLLKRAVESVLHQDYSNIEILIVDDGSEDGTAQYLEELAKCERQVKFLVNKSNSGACISRNRAISISSGELVTGLDDDDYFLPQRVSSLVKAWCNRAEKTVAVCTNSYILGKKNSFKKTRRPRLIRKEDLLDSNFVGNQVLTERTRLERAGGFDATFPAWQDLDLWYRLLMKEGSQIECSKEATYVLDIGHPHERISSSKIGKIKDAFERFSGKHCLTDLERRILAIQICHYENSAPPLYAILLKVIRNPTTINLLQAARLVLRKSWVGKIR